MYLNKLFQEDVEDVGFSVLILGIIFLLIVILIFMFLIVFLVGEVLVFCFL